MWKNKCIKHGLAWDFEGGCPHCTREEYESKFQAECYKNAEERHYRYIVELKETISAQSEEINRLKSQNKKLKEALKIILNNETEPRMKITSNIICFNADIDKAKQVLKECEE